MITFIEIGASITGRKVMLNTMFGFCMQYSFMNTMLIKVNDANDEKIHILNCYQLLK